MPLHSTSLTISRSSIAVAATILFAFVTDSRAEQNDDSSVESSNSRPNVIVILADDLGIGDLSCYGATDLRSPHIDALGESGIRFTNFYANGSVCSPTRASLLTGCYPDRVGVPGVIRTNPIHNWGYFSPEAVTIADVLGQAGYDTALVGKWHLGIESPNLPNQRGFRHFHGFLGDMMDDYWDHRRTGVNFLRLNQQEIDPEGHATTLFTDWAIDYLKGRADEQEPFFLYLAYTAPHTPIQPPQEWLDKVVAREQGIDPKRAKLVALIEHMDHEVGRVLDSLLQSGLRDNTLVIFTSDNGGALHAGADNGSWRGSKGSLWEGGIRVPMIASWPGNVSAGTESDTVSITMDLFPTLCEAVGASCEQPIDGVSLLPSLKGEAQQFDRDLIWMRLEGNNAMGRRNYSIRRGDWKIVQPDPFSKYELFNLASDPAEQSNIRGGKLKGTLWPMVQSLQLHIQQCARTPWQR